jgi:hypothetical protein
MPVEHMGFWPSSPEAACNDVRRCSRLARLSYWGARNYLGTQVPKIISACRAPKSGLDRNGHHSWHIHYAFPPKFAQNVTDIAKLNSAAIMRGHYADADGMPAAKSGRIA